MKSLRHRILLTLLLVGLLPVLVSLAVTVTLTSKDAEMARHREMRTLGSEMVRQIGTIMASAQANLASMSTNSILTSKTQPLEGKRQEFERLKRVYDTFFQVSLLDEGGWQIESTNRAFSAGQDKTKWFHEVMQGRPRTTPPEVDTERDEPGIFCNVYQPIVPEHSGNQPAKPLGAVRAQVRFDKIWTLLRGARTGNGSHFILTDESGNILFHPRTELIFEKLTDFLPLSPTGPDEGRVMADGKEFIFDSLRIPKDVTGTEQEWVLHGLLPREEAIAIATKSQIHQILAAAVSLIVASILGAVWGRKIARHVSDAAVAAGKVAGGDLETRLPESGPTEMVALAGSFNRMTHELKLHRDELEGLVRERTADVEASRKRLAALAGQLRAAFEASQEAILVVDLNGAVVAANARVKEFFGMDPDTAEAGTLELSLGGCFVNPEAFSTVWNELSASHEATGDGEYELAKPAERHLALFSAPVTAEDGQVIARLWTFRDVTERHRLEEGLRQAQKMEAIGRLAGGVAHDFNNLLQGILGNIALLEADHGDVGGPAGERIAMARQAGTRATQIVKQLLGFSRKSKLNLSNCRLNEVIGELHNIIVHTFDPKHQVSIELGEGLWRLKADATQIEQVVMNMVVNARDAMPGKGQIRISTDNVSLSEADAAQMPEGRAGDFVHIRVRDNGHGMPPEVLQKIFEPFFTTKEQGKGTGLGLATSFGIVHQHGGWIMCESSPGVGTQFDIYLPRCVEEIREDTAPVVLSGPVRGGGETVLLVDDEVVVRAVAQGVLKKLGYKILTAGDGEEALEILANGEHHIDLVMLDLTMPRLSGKDTFATMRRGPARDIPVIICSGYLVDLDGFAIEAGSRPDAFVQKPYSLDDLGRAVRSVLDNRPAALSA